MISKEREAEIVRLYHAEKWKLGTIAAQLGMHHGTVRRVLDWDYSIFLQVRFDVSIPRGAQRGEGVPDPAAPYNHRYIQGQEIYLRTCRPERFATVTINNDDLATPRIITPFERASLRE